MLNFIGVISGPVYDRGYVKTLIYGGGVLNVVGLLATSFTTQYHFTILSLGICVGVGSGMLYVPSLAIVASSFTTKRPLAAGLSAAGSSIGGVVYPVLFRLLVERLGFPWTCRVFAFVNGGLLLASFPLVRPQVVPTAGRKLVDTSASRDRQFLLYSMALFLLWLGVDLPFYFLPSFIQDRLGISPLVGDYLLSAMNASSLLGRVFLGFVAVYWGTLGTWQLSIGASCVLLAAWAAIGNLPGIIVFVICYGFFTGAVISLATPALLVISPDIGIVGSRLGMSSVFAGVGFLVGPPIAGAIQKSPIGYYGESAFGGSTYLIGFVVVLLIHWGHRQKGLRDAPEADSTEGCTDPEVTLVTVVVGPKRTLK